MNNKSRHFHVISVHFEKHHSSSFNNIEIKIYQTERMLEDIQCPKPLKNERKRKKERKRKNKRTTKKEFELLGRYKVVDNKEFGK